MISTAGLQSKTRPTLSRASHLLQFVHAAFDLFSPSRSSWLIRPRPRRSAAIDSASPISSPRISRRWSRTIRSGFTRAAACDSPRTPSRCRLGQGGLWKTATALRPYRQDFLDVREGVAGTHTVVEENGKPVLLALRLKVFGLAISEVETMVVRNKQEGVLFEPEAFTKPNAGMTYVPKPSELNDRDEMIRIASLYPAGLRAGSFVMPDVPMSSDAYRFENGRKMAGPGCTFQPPSCEDMKNQAIPTAPRCHVSSGGRRRGDGRRLVAPGFRWRLGARRQGRRDVLDLRSVQGVRREDSRGGSDPRSRASRHAIRMGPAAGEVNSGSGRASGRANRHRSRRHEDRRHRPRRQQRAARAFASTRRATTTRPRWMPSLELIADLQNTTGPAATVGIGIPGTIATTGLVKNANSTWLIGRPLQIDLESACRPRRANRQRRQLLCHVGSDRWRGRRC